MQCSQLHQIAENYGRTHCNALHRATFSELNHTLAQPGAVLVGQVGGAVHAEIIHISYLHRSVPMSHITIVCIPCSRGDPLFLPVGAF